MADALCSSVYRKNGCNHHTEIDRNLTRHKQSVTLRSVARAHAR
jgi:hypothetical protein